MFIEKNVTVDLVEVVGNTVQVRTRTSMMEGDQEISASYHRHVVMPGECNSGEDPRVQAICAAVHTSDVVAAYRAEQARIKAEADAAAAKAAVEAEAARIAAEEEMLKQQLDQQSAFDAAVAEAVRKALTGGQ
jgi:hypothetical protein